VSRPIVRVLLLGAPGRDGVDDDVAADGTRFLVQAVDDVDGAVRELSANRYDCAVLDLARVAVPVGLLAVRAADPSVAIVVLSGAAEEAATIEALSLGAEDYLTRGHIDPVVAGRAVRFAIARKRAETSRVRTALQDPLTGMPNRLAVEEHLAIALQRAERRGTRIALVFVDLDGLDGVAAERGRKVADEALVVAGERVREVARESDAVGRLEGDHFVVVCEDLSLEVSVRRLAQRIEEVLAEPVPLPGGDVHLEARLAFASGGPSQSPAALLRRLPGAGAGLAFGP
jgi:diguanylate cyclase (GGDEF)-like protein